MRKTPVHYGNLAFAAWLFGAVFLLYGIYVIGAYWSATRWPVTTGAVGESEVVSGSESSEFPRVIYTYSVDGRKFTSSRISPWVISTNARAAAIVAKYPVGKSVSVSYDPDRPERSLLEPEMPISINVVALAGIGLILAGYWARLKHRSLGEVAGSGDALYEID